MKTVPCFLYLWIDKVLKTYDTLFEGLVVTFSPFFHFMVYCLNIIYDLVGSSYIFNGRDDFSYS